LWIEAICTTKHNEPIILHQTASYLAVDVRTQVKLWELMVQAQSSDY